MDGKVLFHKLFQVFIAEPLFSRSNTVEGGFGDAVNPM
ncbi:hypothetical protein DCCM_1989 [Desulfocucumis palustris]|uniref:Uncharacterized protein n=1 Tax=Desulfocucumis palustris TaxID=1898651 RepID=A0A2L2XA14_9FIRM|nr:hypothetical protein DCCM_1989 [Desulfocucumis palustris]